MISNPKFVYPIQNFHYQMSNDNYNEIVANESNVGKKSQVAMSGCATSQRRFTWAGDSRLLLIGGSWRLWLSEIWKVESQMRDKNNCFWYSPNLRINTQVQSTRQLSHKDVTVRRMTTSYINSSRLKTKWSDSGIHMTIPTSPPEIVEHSSKFEGCHPIKYSK